MRVALAQLDCIPGDVPANLARARQEIASRSGVELIVFPELFLSGYLLDSMSELACDLDGPEIAALRESCATASRAAVIGIAERYRGTIANSAVFIAADGSIAGVYRKIHLYGAERDAFQPGSDLVAVEVAGRRFGAMICFDVEFPELARNLALSGVDALLTISANPAPFADDHELAMRARSMESNLPHIYVNRAGDEAGFDFVGGSGLVHPTGDVQDILGEDPGVLEGELPPPGRRAEALNYLDQLRPEVYRPIQDSDAGSPASESKVNAR